MPESNLTKKALAAAMKQLMAEKPFARISVSDICEACGMNRKSFYYHFKDKYDLVNWIFYVGFVGRIDVEAYESGMELLDNMCRYFYEQRTFYQAALKIEGQNSFRDYFEEVLRPVLLFFVKDLFVEGDENEEFFVTFFCDAFLAAIRRWLSEGTKLDAEQFILQLHTIIYKLAKEIVDRELPEESR